MVAIQENIFIAVGTAIIMVAAVKYALESKSKPTVVLNHKQTRVKLSGTVTGKS